MLAMEENQTSSRHNDEDEEVDEEDGDVPIHPHMIEYTSNTVIMIDRDPEVDMPELVHRIELSDDTKLILSHDQPGGTLTIDSYDADVWVSNNPLSMQDVDDSC